MIRTARLRTATLPLVAVLSMPSVALAASGGSGVAVSAGASASVVASSPAANPTATTAHIASVSGDGITLTGRQATMLHGWLPLRGSVTGGGGQTISLQLLSGTTWTTVASAVTASNGKFYVVWHPATLGNVSLRAQLGGGASVSPALVVTVYRPATATYYGPGFWGHKTACGKKLTRKTVGVANRKLPCGTQVSLFYHDETITVPVIDRGPYANGANWDLTEATATALGMTETEKIGALAVSYPPN